MIMAVIGPDGMPTESGSQILLAIRDGARSAEEIANTTDLALFTVRSGLRDLERARLIRRIVAGYELSDKGIDLLS